jgi:outer membrane protein assembly factor BamB
LHLDAPLVALDAATGQIVRTYGQTQATEEVVYSDGILFALIDEQPSGRPWSTKPKYTSIAEILGEAETWAWDAPPRYVAAIAADSGELLWKKPATVVPMTLTADDTRVYCHDGDRIVALDRQTGEQCWAAKPLPRAEKIRSWFAPTLVAHKDVILFAGGEKMKRHRGGRDSMTALDANNGAVLWTAPHPAGGYDSPEDILVIDDLVWTAPLTNNKDSGKFTGRDLRTGEIKRTFPANDGGHMPHHRCHRAKATANYILASRTGIEYVDLEAEHWNRNDWVRGACLYGVMPANGLTYAPPHSCACYITAMLNGLNALAPGERKPRQGQRIRAARLEKGPAYDTLQVSDFDDPPSDTWPTYRHDSTRSGRTTMAVPSGVESGWRAKLSGKLSAPVVAEGKVFVAEVDRHTVQAVDAETGTLAWSYTAGGRVDSPPTVWRGRVLFGSADGHIYCVRATDGVLVWRFCAAPADERLVSFEQLESVWPVHGSVLVNDGHVHAVAGRSMFLDGGLHYIRIDAATGELISENVMNDLNPETGKPLDAAVRWPNLPVALPDILSYDGQSVYMRSQQFDLKGKRRTVDTPNNKKLQNQTGPGAHLFCPTGFLDDSWWHRTYWMWGKTPGSSAGRWFAAGYVTPAGRILAFDEEYVYGFGRKPQHFPQTTTLEYHVFRVSKTPELVTRGKPRKGWLPTPKQPVHDWSIDVPLLGRALLVAGETLFVAGPPDVVDTYASASTYTDPNTQAALAAQRDAMAGQHGGLLLAVSLADGTTLNHTELDAVPVFDGMAAAYGKLYLATIDGQVICLGGAGRAVKKCHDNP